MKNYLVIGGTAGIGLSVCEQLLAAGHELMFTGTKPDRNSYVLPFSGGIYYKYEVLNDEAGSLVVPEKLDGLVYCPGTISLKPFVRISDEDFLTEYKVNVLGAIQVLRECIPALKNSGSGSVVLFSTIAATQGMPFHTSIASAKAAVEGLTRSLAAEYAPSVRVNCVAPSLTDTRLAEKLLNTEEKRLASAKRHPMQAIGTPKDLSEMVVFLLSDSSKWITGQVFHVDGGMSAIRSM